MKEISESSKIMVLFGVLTIYINSLKDIFLKKSAHRWFLLLNKYANQMWKELTRNIRDEGDAAELVYDEMEAFIYEVNKQAFEVPLDRVDDYLNYLKKWNSGSVLENEVEDADKV